MSSKAWLELDKNGFIKSWATTNATGTMIETKIDVDDYRLQDCPNYRYVDGRLIHDTSNMVDDYKKKRIEQLNEECSKRIQDGFDYPVNGEMYHFGFDYADQLNFSSTFMMMAMGAINEIGWTCYKDNKVCRVTLNKEDMNRISAIAIQHKNKLIEDFREVIQPYVEQMDDKKMIQNLSWEELYYRATHPEIDRKEKDWKDYINIDLTKRAKCGIRLKAAGRIRRNLEEIGDKERVAKTVRRGGK